MKFHLNHTPVKPGFEIAHSDKVLLIGSCFSENIGTLLHDRKFNTLTNPWGILFNPLSIYKNLNGLLTPTPPEDKYLLQRGDTWFSYLHHSSINKPTAQELQLAAETENKTAHQFLKEASYLILTFGTAWYYRHIGLNEAVANCHKQPAATFEKQLSSVNDLTTLYAPLLQQLQAFNPKLKVIFTVSPVKHLRDGLVENNLSKATLLLAIHQLVAEHNNCFYFPAYELVTDDLRDYRFYKEDLAHPNEQAIEYVWEKFSTCYFSETTKDLNQKIEKLNLALQHRQLYHNEAEANKLQEFIRRQKEEIEKLLPKLIW